MSNKLSHSAINKFLQCGEAYRLHYQERIRPTEVGSALIFGSALGKAFEYKLNTKFGIEATVKEEKSQSDLEKESKFFKNKKTITMYDIFDYHWKYQTINNELTNLEEYPFIAYSKYDLDEDLADTPYESLRVKAHLILDTFEKEFLPKVLHVYSTEEKIQLANEEGDESIGFADAVVDLDGYERPVIIDFKTAARAYELDSARKSVQLAQYLHVLGEKYNTRYVGYCVFLKNISKNRTKICSKCKFDGSGSRHKTCSNEINEVRCNGEWKEKIKPKAEMQLIVDTIPETFEYFVIDNIENVNLSIKNNIFVKNVNSCFDNGFGRPCEFLNLCHKGNMNGLVQLEKRVDKLKK